MSKSLLQQIEQARRDIEAVYSFDLSETPFAHEMDLCLAQAEAAMKDAAKLAERVQEYVDEHPERNEAAIRY